MVATLIVVIFLDSSSFALFVTSLTYKSVLLFIVFIYVTEIPGNDDKSINQNLGEINS